jgi:hypothetical protein
MGVLAGTDATEVASDIAPHGDVEVDLVELDLPEADRGSVVLR